MGKAGCSIKDDVHAICWMQVIKEWRQVNGKTFFELKGDIIIEIVQETSPDTGMHNRAITVLHEQWMCLGNQRHTHITLCNLVTI